MSDDLDGLVDDVLKNILSGNQGSIKKIKANKPPEQRVGLYNTKVTEFLKNPDIEQKFVSFAALREHAELYFLPTDGKTYLDGYVFF